MVDAGSPTLPSGIPYVLISILVPLDSDMVTGAVSLLACSPDFRTGERLATTTR